MTAIRIVEDHSELENIGNLSHNDIDNVISGSSFLVASTVSGALGDSRILTAGPGISINDTGPGGIFEISFSAAVSYNLQFSLDLRVPAGGSRYLKYGTVYSSSAPVVLSVSSTLRAISISADTVDLTRDYQLEVLVNSIVVATLTLSSGNLTNYNSGYSVGVSPSDTVSARIVRLSGSGSSSFSNIVSELNFY